MATYTPTVEIGLDRMRDMARGDFDLAWMDSNPAGWGHEVRRSKVGLNLTDVDRGFYGEVPEHGSSHGNLWNATVWSECRQMASRHFAELAEKYDHVSRSASELSARYAEIGNALNTLGDKEMDAGEKIALLEDTKEKESTAIKMVAAFAASLRSGG